ncbi:VTT domain-containing protein [Clostridium sp. 'White wine YQ']|uniref:VTT domain-containing protein n=1 Tax=Clostridium sp. 'White wine YQ' TaxID=3027474 RepID=UPI002366E35F|nr:VTT domain-containing protein [Clostridium sp. 'White wine YQ']MDD7795336.1 VTT domain-containing protein [Clostridium sp. 'White wine YQ']
MHTVLELINQYGYIILFFALILELIAFPLPGELIMTYCGFLIYDSRMNWLLSILVASSGAALGITISYFAGTKLGISFFKKYGSYIHLGPERLEKTSSWFNSYGNRLLIFAYFIPGVRHITGYFSGITQISYKKFSINAYLGALIWASTFISLGKFLGPNWDKFHGYISRYLLIGSLVILIILVIIYSYKNHKNQIIEFTYKYLTKALTTFHSLGRIKVTIVFISAAFLGFFALLIGLIQDYLANELEQFDRITSYLVSVIFDENWSFLLDLISNLTSFKVLIPLMIFMLIFITRKGVDPFLEIRFLTIVVLGGEAYQFILRYIFKRISPSPNLLGTIQYSFPSKESLMAIITYSFVTFILIRHSKKTWINTVLVLITISICILSGLNPLFFHTEYPSDVYAGYIFGGVWLTLNIILLEIYRIMPKVQP